VRFGEEAAAALGAVDGRVDGAPLAAVAVGAQARSLQHLLAEIAERQPGAVGDAGQEALRRHPSGRYSELGPDGRRSGPQPCPAAEGLRPVGPDDDPEFLAELDRRLRGEGDGDGGW